MSLQTILIAFALVLALIDEFRSQGQSLTGWAVALVCIALLYGHIG